jgi:RNA recognition motif-containing protein
MSQNRTIYVGNIPPRTKAKEVGQEFEKYALPPSLA